jgi:hypothetical protein
MGHVQQIAFGVFELFQRQRGLAAARTANNDQRRQLAIGSAGRLCIVSRSLPLGFGPEAGSSAFVL